MSPRLHLALLLVGIGCALPASAQDTVHKDGKGNPATLVPEARWGKLGTKDFGKLFCVEGRWSQVAGSGILLYKADANTKRFLRISPGPLKEYLTSGLDSGGKKLERKRSIVRLFGKASPSSQGTYLNIEFAEKLPDADVSYRAELEQIGDDPEKIAALGARCLAEATRFEDAKLKEVAQEIARHELQVRAKALGPKDNAKVFALAERFRNEAKDDASAIELYARVYEAEDAPQELREKAKQELLVLRAVRVRRDDTSWTWVTYKQFKASEGYLERKEGDEVIYVRREYAELLEVVDRETKRQASKIDPPRQNPFKSGQEARSGTIARGQTYAEVRQAAKCFPASVYHKVLPWGAEGQALWTQWILPNGSRVYFLSVQIDERGGKVFPPGEVVERRTADTPWPEK